MPSAIQPFAPLTGHCPCKTLSYTLTSPPLITNACHCSDCRHETGTAFAVNMVIETANLDVTAAAPCTQPFWTNIPTFSGKGQQMARCPKCYVAVYSHYGAVGPGIAFVKAGTLDGGCRGRVRPDAHVFVGAKDEWVDLGAEVESGVGVYEEMYRVEDVWSEESLERRRVAMLGRWETGGVERKRGVGGKERYGPGKAFTLLKAFC